MKRIVFFVFGGIILVVLFLLSHFMSEVVESELCKGQVFGDLKFRVIGSSEDGGWGPGGLYMREVHFIYLSDTMVAKLGSSRRKGFLFKCDTASVGELNLLISNIDDAYTWQKIQFTEMNESYKEGILAYSHIINPIMKFDSCYEGTNVDGLVTMKEYLEIQDSLKWQRHVHDSLWKIVTDLDEN